MSLPLSQIILPIFTKGLQTLSHILTVAEQHAKSNGLDPNTEYPSARLAPDMLPLTFQVQNATTAIRKTLDRLTGQETQAWKDDEKTIADLQARVKLGLELLQKTDAGKIDASVDKTVELPFAGKTVKLSGRDTALNQGIPNFFFHLQTAYAILRSKGVPIGKVDFLGSFLAE